jgi:ketosteroid isomerase-like protein
MSQENVEIVRRGIDHYNETGEPPWELLDPEVEWTIDPPAWLAGTYRGHTELKELTRRIAEIFDEFRYDMDDFLPVGDRVIGIGAIRVRGAQSGATALQQGASVSRLRDGRIVAVRIYLDRERALRDVGLRE